MAVTYIWYYSDTREIVEVGMVFNKLYAWGIDPDGEGPQTINTFDIQNVATHEAGHTLSLNDLYMDEAAELTMNGYTSQGETRKRSLGLGDIKGINSIYGGMGPKPENPNSFFYTTKTESLTSRFNLRPQSPDALFPDLI